ncbi:MAG: cytochrome c oxidase accessory protein CcoG [Sterolibacteriaceae bacterium]|uniref:Cytochrome c oxidase accessory protein CcoG n=1 Tax=Candidatus Methylophosphatis roskildensis TaxID=2899263 RepID=A0A9D7E757_9PROT|nr:cytochrome c oxidase accessory protein CcoG [Candidatus Methylophosphatis roskildensis]MBK7235490.1 cytochrome c oxidase accessory protein CcoG [Sterolibacteriaceae bacterium]
MNDPAPLSAAKIIPVVQEQEDTLYAVRQRIYPRAVSGRFATWRWALVWITQAVFYGLCWFDWNGRQAVLFHLVERKFYIFGWVFWPQDVFFLTLILLISAFSLFLFTAVAGRLWCGYACPQTVYTEIFMWIEEKIEGDRPKRMKLDQQPKSARKFRIKATKHAAWIAVGLWTGFTFVGYFTPIRELAGAVGNWTLGPWETFWILFYGFATYGNAGFMREQVCKYMCPYARFQGVMFDPDTLTITYDTERGQPRGARNKRLDYKAAGLGDCVDCGICVQVCPTGIDIRDGLQYECIGCAACIDACDQVMDKMSYPKGLIRYSTENAIKEHWGRREILRHLMRPRTLVYTSILSVVVVGFIYGLTTRIPLRVDVIRDRATLAREVEDGKIENVFRLQVTNTAEETRRFALGVSGLDKIDLASDRMVEVPPASTRSVIARVVAPGDSAGHGSHPIFFEVKATEHQDVFVREKASFLLP